VRLEPTDYQGWEAAIWEYRYGGQHAYNLGFVVSDDQGYALNLVVPEGSWDDAQPAWEEFTGTFRPPE
jgi:hypothetical protein